MYKCDILTNIIVVTEDCPVSIATCVAENGVKNCNAVSPDDTDTTKLLDNANKHNN